MKRSLYSILFVILLAFTTVFFVSCNGGQTGDGDKSVPENVVLPDIEMAGGYTASITDGSARTAVCYTQGEGSPLTVIVTRTDKTGSEVAVSKEYYYRGVSDGGEYYLVIRSNGDKHVYANGYEYLYGATAYDRESFTFFSSDMILTEMNLAANPYVYDIFGGAGKAYNLAKFKKYSGGVSQYRASGADLNSLLVPDTAVVDMWISSKGVVTRFRITDGKNVIVNVRYTKVGETDSPALPSDVELSKVCAHNFVWTPDENGTHKGVCTYDESHIVTGLSCYGGVATCVSGRKCDLCGGEYGDVDPDSRDFAWKSNGDGTHTEVCKRNEEHKGRTESCWDFTEATCVEKATCKVCGGESGEIAPENHDYKWVANGDGTHTQICTRDEKHIGLTENCSGGKATCTEQATCEVCGEKYGEPLGHKLPDKWTKGEGDKHIKRCLNEGCSYYEEEACSGGEAICIGKAICDVCGGEYGEIDENNHYYEWVSNGDGTHTEVCKRNREHKGKTEECRGGKATCTEKAVCEVCGEKYGEPLGHDFSVWVEVDKDYHKKVCSHDEKHVYQTQKHNFGKWTSDGNGKHYRVCETCNRREEAACNFSEPTCTEKAKCGVCGAEKGEPKGHLYGDFVSNGDGTHKKVCSACGDEIKGKCTGGKATCVEKAKCDVCHGEYGEFDTNNHDLQTVQNVGENTHTTTCKRTGCTYSVTENCSGGKATCTEKATCKVCGGKYGEVDLTNHAYKWKSNGDGTHTEVCSRDESHKGRTENCSGGTANCVEKATCKVCGDKYGEIDANNHDLKTEQNADGKTHTTVCGRKGCTYSKTENCSGGEATCTEKATCEVCGKKYGEPLNHVLGEWTTGENDKHVRRCAREGCSYFEEEACKGGEATCTEKAICEVCGAKYGKPLGHNLPDKWTKGEGDKHIKKCLRDGCNYFKEENCSGGTATCTEKATCEVCGGKYGEVDSTNHAYEWKSNGDGTHTEVCSRDNSHKGRTENCSGGTANCVEKATCEVCGGKYGEIDANNHDLKTEQNADGKTHTTACGRKGCTYSKTENCSGGEATCTEKAICEVCGKKYGEALLKYEESGDGYILAGVTETGKTKLTENDLIVIANEYEGKKIIGISAEAMGDIVANAKFAGISFENDNIETLDAGLFKEFIKGLADKEIKGLKLEKGIYLIGKVDGENFGAKWAIGSKGAEATLPENVNIAKGLFGNDAEITTVTVGKGVKLYDGILTEFGGNTLKIDFGNAFFNGKTAAALFNGSIYSSSMPYAEVVGDGDEIYYVPMSLENAVVLSENVPAGAFRNMSMLKTVDLQNVKEIGERAFMGCSGITSVTLSGNLEKINAYAFYGSSAITEITIPKSVKKVGTYAFGECGELTVTVEYDKGTDKRYNAIEASAFYKSVVTVKFGGTEAEWKGFVKADWNYSGEATVEYAA